MGEGEKVPNKMNGEEGSRTKLAAFVAAIIHGTNCTGKWKSLGNAATCKNALILVYEPATPPAPSLPPGGRAWLLLVAAAILHN